MAFGFPASSSQVFALNNVSKKSFTLLTIAISKNLKWNCISLESYLIFETNNDKDTWNETVVMSFIDENIFIKSSSNGNQVYDAGKNKKNIDSFLKEYYDSIGKNSNDEIDDSLFEKITSSNTLENINKIADNTTITSFYTYLSVLVPTNNYFITPFIILVNILLFFLMVFNGVSFFSPETQDIIDWGGNYAPLTIENGWWRLLSSCFLHFGFFHLILNCYALGYVGLLLEPYFKKISYLSIYLFCGILSSLSSLYWNENIVSAGASGAILGMYSLLTVLMLSKQIKNKNSLNLITAIISFIVLNISGSFKEGIDGAAHIGGLVTGLVFGFILVLLHKKPKIAISSISILTVVFSVVISNYCRQTKVYIYQFFEYEKEMQDFVDMEKMALSSYGNFFDNSKEQILSDLKDRGIYYWDENIALIKKLDKLYLPKEIHIQNENLLEYCELYKEY
nr:rhomboid family intramembrane serine protease [uncultured Flavobacterium sp.]